MKSFVFHAMILST